LVVQRRRCLALVLALLAPSGLALAQARPAPPSLRMVRIDTPPVIDGTLDDDVWHQAAHIERLIQVEPVEGGEPSERTDIYIAYDADAIYIAARCWDSEPDKIVATQMARDAGITDDDRIAIVIDTFHDHRNAFFFQIGAAGGRRDGLVQNNRTLRVEWNGIWRARSSIDAQGWSMEAAIPYKSLNFAPGATTWGFNILRGIRRRNETARWSAAYQNIDFIDVSEVGHLDGIEDIDQGLGLDIRPGLSLGPRWDNSTDRSYSEVDPSGDVFYKPWPSVTAAFTANTDFSEAAVDERRVNLTRFDLFFPETRQFFLQDAGIFDFGGLEGENGIPFFSRRIGIADDGDEVPLRAGIKTTGRIGRWNFGAFDVQMDSHGDVDRKNLSVGRLFVNLAEESGVGVIATHGDPVTNGSNTLFGTDLRLRTSHAFENQIAELNAWFQRSHQSGVSDEQAAYGVELEYPNDRINGVLRFAEIQENFRPALGFVNRTGIRDTVSTFRYRIRPADSPIRTVDFGWDGRVVTDTSNNLESVNGRLNVIDIANHVGDSISLHYRRVHERLLVPFEIAPGVILPPDRYHWDRYEFEFETAVSRPLQLIGVFGYGDFFSGKRRDIDLVVAWRPSRHFFARLEYEENRVRLDEGDFTTRIGRVRLNIYFTPDISWETFGQWDSISEAMAVNSRIRWIIQVVWTFRY
jgi:hypothetical protein